MSLSIDRDPSILIKLNTENLESITYNVTIDDGSSTDVSEVSISPEHLVPILGKVIDMIHVQYQMIKAENAEVHSTEKSS